MVLFFLVLVAGVALTVAAAVVSEEEMLPAEAPKQEVMAAAAEGNDRFNAFLRNAKTEAAAATQKKRQYAGNLNQIGTCDPFALKMHTWGDDNMVGARLVWGQIQDFIAKCGSGDYSDEWCDSLVSHMQNSAAYRELEISVLHTMAPWMTGRHTLSDNSEEEEKEDEGEREHARDVNDMSMAAYTRKLRRYLNYHNKKKTV